MSNTYFQDYKDHNILSLELFESLGVLNQIEQHGVWNDYYLPIGYLLRSTKYSIEKDILPVETFLSIIHQNTICSNSMFSTKLFPVFKTNYSYHSNKQRNYFDYHIAPPVPLQSHEAFDGQWEWKMKMNKQHKRQKIIDNHAAIIHYDSYYHPHSHHSFPKIPPPSHLPDS